MESKTVISVIYLDLGAAFDTVNHSIFLKVMENHLSITNTALKWMSSYFQNRKFSVHINDFSSDIKTINFSLPQGNILCPTVFNCYVSTLMEIIPETEDNFVSGCADAHALMNSFHPENIDILSTLASDMTGIKDWMDNNELKINNLNIEFILFRSKHQFQTNTFYSLKVDDTVITAKKKNHKIS